MELLAGLEIEAPVIQAGMGGGIAGADLAAAVSQAGGLGTIGLLPPAQLEHELQRARSITAGPIAINLIVPLTRKSHWRAAAGADVIVTHWERRPKRRTATRWIHTCGSAEEAQLAVEAGADGVIAQGLESGGHVRGKLPGLELLERIRAVLPANFPLMVAGGVAERADVATCLAAGARAAIAGTRFVASAESGAHPGYKERLLGGEATLLTELFGMGWPRAPHRVLANGATNRWLDEQGDAPGALGLAHALLSPIAGFAAPGVQARLARRSSTAALDLLPYPPVAGMPAATLESHPLYAGETVARINSIEPAAALVAALTP